MTRRIGIRPTQNKDAIVVSNNETLGGAQVAATGSPLTGPNPSVSLNAGSVGDSVPLHAGQLETATPSNRDAYMCAAIDLVSVTATLADHCLRLESCSPISPSALVEVGEQLRNIAVRLFRLRGTSLVASYAKRIADIEAMSILRHRRIDIERIQTPAELLATAETWSDIQIAQMLHDRQFHPDVFGMSKINQLTHYTLHVMKIPSSVLQAASGEGTDGELEKRIVDIAVFGVKFATLKNVRLSDEPVDAN